VIFSLPITCFLPQKCHLLTAVLPFSAMFLMELKGFVYTIAMYFYAFRLAFSGILHCILPHFVLRFAAKRTAFSTKTQCV
jgi:hypothetical protein